MHVAPKMISDGESTTGPHDDGEDGGLADLLSDFDGCDGSRSPAYLEEDPFDLVDMEVGDCMDGGVWRARTVWWLLPCPWGGHHGASLRSFMAWNLVSWDLVLENYLLYILLKFMIISSQFCDEIY